MEYKKFGKTYIVRMDKGEEIVDTLKKFCKEQSIRLGTVTGLGATNKAVVGLFEISTKKYHSKEFTGDFELCPLYGNISTQKGETYLHIHVNISDIEHKSYGGHLSSAVVSATFEAVITAIDGEIDREFSQEIGLNLMKF